MVYRWLKNNLSGSVGSVCLLCGDLVVGGPGLCLPCLQGLPAALDGPPPPGIDRLLAAFSYDWPVDRLIAAFKYRAGIAAGLALTRCLQYRVEASLADSPAIDLLLPVPLHPRRYRQRGFNQAREIAELLSAGLDIPRLTANRLSHDAAQAGKTAGERRRSRARFAIERDLSGMRVAIIDDVVTSGATVRALALRCRAAGAARVEVWCLAQAVASR